MSLLGPASATWLLSLPFAFALLFVYLRHAPLALLATIAPVPGLLLADVTLGYELTGAYAFGFCIALLAAGQLLRPLLLQPADWRGLAAAGAAAAFASLLVNQHVAPAFNLSDWYPVLVLLCAAVSAGGLVWAGRRLAFGEAFIARANRAAEWRARLLETASHIAEPRWAWAVSGIGVAMAALGWFEILPHDPPEYPSIVVLVAAAFVLARDWRAAAAAGLCGALLWLFRAEVALPFFALPALLLAASSRGRGEEGPPAWRRTLEEEGAGLWFAAFGGTFLLFLVFDGVSWLPGLEAFIAALVFFPALTAALWGLLPRRRSVEDMYRG